MKTENETTKLTNPSTSPAKFLEDREVAKFRLPRYAGWYWWRAAENSDPVRYYIQFDGRQATPEHGGPTIPTSALGGEWGREAPDPDEEKSKLNC